MAVSNVIPLFVTDWSEDLLNLLQKPGIVRLLAPTYIPGDGIGIRGTEKSRGNVRILARELHRHLAYRESLIPAEVSRGAEGRQVLSACRVPESGAAVCEES